MPPRVFGILETSLYVADVARAVRFYESVFGFETLSADERMSAMSVPGTHVLLLFKKGASTDPMPLPGGMIPPHDAEGRIHIAFSTTPEDLTLWERHLDQQGVAIESRVTWPRGGTSIYFRDPDGHLIELATPGIWTTY